jgi:hypothetical protein
MFACWALLCAVPVGCTMQPNPSFPVTTAQAKAALSEMRRDPQPLERPVIIAAGLFDAGMDVQQMARTLRRVTDDGDMVTTATFMSLTTGSFDGCRDFLIEKVERSWGTTGTGETIEVDVIGFSMGGLVARHASRPRTDGGTRLVIRRLFTISTPHQGARMADWPTLDDRTIDMRTGSEFLAELDDALPDADYTMYNYTRLGDWIVGAENAAPPGQTAWWVPTPPASFSHLGAATDPRIMADIARRLRGDLPLTTEPPAPLSEVSDKTEITATTGSKGT